jgi:uncharacterized protein
MNSKYLVQQTVDFVKEKFQNEGSGHDWWHIYRVWQLAKHIAAQEKGANMLIVELGALLHDIADFKFHGGDLEAGPKAARQLLNKFNVDEKIIHQVCHIVGHVSFKGADQKNGMQSLEGKIVQDADRLDAIGAIGLARVFAYAGYNGNVIYDPEVNVRTFKDHKEYVKYKTTAINHFYEKLLLLKDRMNTKTGKKLAEHRHKIMEDYLTEFYAEWDGKK